jgi:hypothetical protein
MNETLKHVMEDIEAELAVIIAALNTAAISKGNKERRDFRAIKQETGINSSWLSLFSDGCIKEPGHKRTRLLEAWLRLNGFLAATTEHDTTMINVPDAVIDTLTQRVSARRGCPPGVASLSCRSVSGV